MPTSRGELFVADAVMLGKVGLLHHHISQLILHFMMFSHTPPPHQMCLGGCKQWHRMGVTKLATTLAIVSHVLIILWFHSHVHFSSSHCYYHLNPLCTHATLTSHSTAFEGPGRLDHRGDHLILHPQRCCHTGVLSTSHHIHHVI